MCVKMLKKVVSILYAAIQWLFYLINSHFMHLSGSLQSSLKPRQSFLITTKTAFVKDTSKLFLQFFPSIFSLSFFPSIFSFHFFLPHRYIPPILQSPGYINKICPFILGKDGFDKNLKSSISMKPSTLSLNPIYNHIEQWDSLFQYKIMDHWDDLTWKLYMIFTIFPASASLTTLAWLIPHNVLAMLQKANNNAADILGTVLFVLNWCLKSNHSNQESVIPVFFDMSMNF